MTYAKKNYMKYLAYSNQKYWYAFEKIQKTDSPVCWNWAAFFAPSGWLIMKRCYGSGLVTLAVFFITNAIYRSAAISAAQSYRLSSTSSSTSASSTLFLMALIQIITSVIIGMYGTNFYKERVEKNIQTEADLRGVTKERFIAKMSRDNVLGGIMYVLQVIGLISSFAKGFAG